MKYLVSYSYIWTLYIHGDNSVNVLSDLWIPNSIIDVIKSMLDIRHMVLYRRCFRNKNICITIFIT